MSGDGIFKEILEALHRRYPERTKSQCRIAAMRVHFNLETEGPVTDVDRLFLGGPDAEDPDAEVLIERTLLEIRDRNAGITDIEPHTGTDGDGR